MLFALALYIGLPASLAVITYLVVSLKKSGYFDDVHIVVLEDPLILSDNITVFYKYCVAGKCKQVYSEVADILPQELTKLLGIFYDNGDTQVLPKVEKAIHSQQKSMSGCFANLALIRKRDQMKTFSKAKNFESTVSVEIYDRLANRVDIFRPLHNLVEFCVPEYLIDTSGHHIGREKLYRSSTTASEEIPTTESGSQLGDEDFPEDLID